MFSQQWPDRFRQEFAEEAVDRKFAREKPDRVLPFETAEVRLVHEISEQALQALRQFPRNFQRYGKGLRLGLPQPAE